MGGPPEESDGENLRSELDSGKTRPPDFPKCLKGVFFPPSLSLSRSFSKGWGVGRGPRLSDSWPLSPCTVPAPPGLSLILPLNEII